MGTSNRRKTGKIFTGSKLIVGGQGNDSILRSKINTSDNILKKPNSNPDSTNNN